MANPGQEPARLMGGVFHVKEDFAALRGETKADIALLRGETKAAIADAKNSIIMWVVSAILLAQLLPSILKKFGL